MKDVFGYYQTHSIVSNPGDYGKCFEDLSKDIGELCDIVHGLLIHRDNTDELYHFKPNPDEYDEANLRYSKDILGKIFEKDSRPISQERKPKKRCFASCRDYSLLLCAILRHQHTPARVRCGFTAYFEPGRFWDHWVCEYWNRRAGRWSLVDPEVGEEEVCAYGIDRKLNFTDLPRDQFVVAGQAWQMFRSGGVDPDLFGVHSIGIHGAWFIRASVFRDLAALNKVELLPWDYTKYFYKFFEKIDELGHKEVKLIDKIADLTARAHKNSQFSKIKSVYQQNREIQVGSTVKSYSTEKPEIIRLQGC